MLLSAVVAAAFLMPAGCGKKEPAANPPVQPPSPIQAELEAQKAAVLAEAQARAEAEKAAAQAQALAQKAEAEAKAAAERAAAEQAAEAKLLQREAQNLISEAKKLVTSKQYPAALDLLDQVAGMNLTAEQKSLVAELKAMIQKLLAAEAAEAAKAAKSIPGLPIK